MRAQVMMRHAPVAEADSYWREKAASTNPVGDLLALAIVLAAFLVL